MSDERILENTTSAKTFWETFLASLIYDTEEQFLETDREGLKV